jgi:hypothetical protein
MEEEITYANDYTNWLRWVYDAKQSRQAMYESTHYAKILVLLQVDQTKCANLDHNSTKQLSTSNHDEMSMKWWEIYQQIRVDIGLDKKKQQ